MSFVVAALLHSMTVAFGNWYRGCVLTSFGCDKAMWQATPESYWFTRCIFFFFNFLHINFRLMAGFRILWCISHSGIRGYQGMIFSWQMTEAQEPSQIMQTNWKALFASCPLTFCWVEEVTWLSWKSMWHFSLLILLGSVKSCDKGNDM